MRLMWRGWRCVSDILKYLYLPSFRLQLFRLDKSVDLYFPGTDCRAAPCRGGSKPIRDHGQIALRIYIYRSACKRKAFGGESGLVLRQTRQANNGIQGGRDNNTAAATIGLAYLVLPCDAKQWNLLRYLTTVHAKALSGGQNVFSQATVSNTITRTTKQEILTYLY
ncbi:hypothetical protein EV356DRAFT_34650 [Viridothelium virens]|uniref:Uncharacterized protein n=1 Tax=Viridothelium virens TaxID=1048519 RepID=A0A6A6GUE2_VIRVR|nr:hypothetical protein EV356DRAFT_34650 [Viridothelium virens]